MVYISGRSKEKVMFERKLFSFPDIFKYFFTSTSTVYLLGRKEFLVQAAEHSIQVFGSARAGQ